jgi:hypothetical protein
MTRPIRARESAASVDGIDIVRLFGDRGFRFLYPPPAEEKTQMPRAALAAAERPQKQGQEKGPFKHATTMGTQYIVAPAKGASPCAHPK